jgi:hypothetical protein
MNIEFEVNGLSQPVDAVCEALEAAGKNSFAASINDVYRIAKRVPELQKQLDRAIATIKGEYPESQWQFYGVPEMEAALKQS